MAEPKTRPTDADVDAFLAAVPDPTRRADAQALDGLLRAASGERPVMWGTSIVGYGELAYPGPRGTTRTWPVIAFAPRTSELVLYLNTRLEPELFADLGRHRRGVGCLYLKRLSDVDPDALTGLLARSVALAREEP